MGKRPPVRPSPTANGTGKRATDVPALPSPNGKPRRRQDDGWLDRWALTVSDLTRLTQTHPMMDAVIEEQRGRRIRIGDRWLADFASCNYLGFDLDEEIMAAIPEYLAKWGTHPSWSRLLGSPTMYPEIEEQTAELLGAPDVLVLPTITHIHTSVIPVLVGDGTIFLDGRAHKTIYDGAMYAAGHGASIVRFRHNDAEHLAELLDDAMTGNSPDLAAFSALATEHHCLLYVDDAHGFGVIGERSADELTPYGMRGNSVFRHLGVPYDSSLLVGGFSKAYSSLLAFVALATPLKDALKVLAPPYLYSGPSPVASLATTLAGLEVNRRRGDLIRRSVWDKTERVLQALRELGIHTPNTSGHPIIEIPLADHDEIDDVGRYLFEHGIYVTMAAYPLAPKAEVGFRIQITAANGDDEIEELIAVLTSLKERFQLEQLTPATA
jgi:8-amino-7-oxononanoate synthase